MQNYNLNVAGGTAKNFLYDNNGNCTTSGSTTYEWDAENRLTAINNGALRSEFTYDGFGRRVKIVEMNNSTVTNTKKFIWYGAQLAEERADNNNVTKRFFAEGEQIGGVNYYFTKDHLGNIREMTDSTGAIRARYDFDPFGRRTKLSGDLDADFGFTGYYVHAPSGLQLALYRAYDADAGRWINRDPIEEEGGLNLYQYVYNSPPNYIDPDGKNPLLLLFLAGAVWGGVMTPYTANAPGPGDPTYPAVTGDEILGNALAGGLLNVGVGGAGMLTDGALPKPKLCPVSRWGGPIKPGEDNWVMTGPVSPLNYAMSGKWQPASFPTFGQPPNIPAPYSSGVTINVPPASLSFPSGPLGPFKGMVGQRIYRP
jgi:RHS repeat-associated protein